MEKLDDLGQRLAKVETQQQNMEKTMERNQVETRGFVERTESRLTGLINDLKQTMMDGQRSINYALHGNGKPGLVDRVGEVEDEIIRLKEAQSVTMNNQDRAWARFSPFVPWIAAVLAAAASYLIGKADHLPK